MSKIAIGHINPDTDTVCSPIAYAWFLSEKLNTPVTPKIAGAINKETDFILKKFGINTPEVLNKFSESDEVILLDTNNPEELLEGIENAHIIGIVDHHKLVGGLHTAEPIRINIKPIACTSTLVWQTMQESKISDLPKDIAGIMLCSILSDTLKFTSPTTTDEDRLAAKELADIAGEDIDKLTEQMFAAKSDLSGMSANDILTVDSKIFEMGKKKIRVSVLETTDPRISLAMSDELKKEMMEIRTKDNVDYIFFFIVDILKTEAQLLVTNEEEQKIAEQAFNKKFENEVLNLPGVVSRKKQMVPLLDGVITKI